MRNNTSIIYNLCLLVGDGFFLILGFTLAYILRVSISHQAIHNPVHAVTYLGFLLILLPFWLIIFGLLGLYSEYNYQNRFSEAGRISIAVFIGILFAISYNYMTIANFFPARLVVIYGYIFSFLAVLLFRTIARATKQELFRYGVGINKVLIVGTNKMTAALIDDLNNTPVSGFKIVGIIDDGKNNPSWYPDIKKYSSFRDAIEQTNPDQLHTIIQTELYGSNEKNNEILSFSQSHHIAYRFVPGNSELLVGNIRVNLYRSTPIITVHQTALVGWGRVVKRLSDIIFGTVLLLISLPFMLLIILAEFINNPRGNIFYSTKRLSRYGNEVRIYKFRTLKQAYTNMSPEEGFAKMGRPDLLQEYRSNGDKLDNDPRLSRLGKFLRVYSLDELPQLFSVVWGSISLVGPRALDPFELAKYKNKNLILAVKTGLTGLAQISGRSDISFEERRRLDLYYVQNWSIWEDISILLRTISVVITKKGAR